MSIYIRHVTMRMKEQSMKFAWLVAIISTLSATAAVHAADVDFYVTVNGDTGTTNVMLGDSVTVGIWATVTDNTYTIDGTPTDLGLAGYTVNVLTDDNSVLAAEAHPVLTSSWNASNEAPDFATGSFMPGLLDNGSVEDLLGAISPPFLDAAESYRTHGAGEAVLLATGTFEALTLGSATLSVSPRGANAVQYDGNDEYSTFAADTDAGAGVLVNVVPEPASAALMGLAGLMLLRRRR